PTAARSCCSSDCREFPFPRCSSSSNTFARRDTRSLTDKKQRAGKTGALWWRVASRLGRRAHLRDLANQLDVNRQLDLVANHDATRLERLIPREVEVASAELRRGADANSVVAPGLLRASLVRRFDRDLSRDVANGEISDDAEFLANVALDALAHEPHRRMVCDIEEVRRAEVIVSHLLARID